MNKSNWIFIRGLTRGNLHWGDFPEFFKDRKDLDVEFLEIPGNGTAANQQTPLFVGHLLEILRSQSRFVKSSNRFHLCGVSLGGMIALKWGELYPKEVLSVTTINSSLRQFSPMYKRLRPQSYLELLRAMGTRDSTERERIILTLTSTNELRWKSHLPQFAEFSKANPISLGNFLRQLGLAQTITIYMNLRAPVRVISSLGDKLVHPDCSKAMAQNFKASHFIHPTAGHDLPLDAPEWLSEVLFSSPDPIFHQR